jgi:hypothetical protein
VISSLDRTSSCNIWQWYLHQCFATWTASPLRECSSVNTTSDVPQHDAAPPHYSRIITHCLNQQYHNWWIGHGGAQNWPLQSSDLNQLNYHVWGYMKAMVYACKVNTRDKLLLRILNAARHINNTTLLHKVKHALVTWVRKCIQADRGHFEQFGWVVNYITVTVQLTIIFNKHIMYFFLFYLIQFTVNTHSSITIANQAHAYSEFSLELDPAVLALSPGTTV